MYQYFIKVVPTVYKQLSGEVSYNWYQELMSVAPPLISSCWHPLTPVWHLAGNEYNVKHSKGAAVVYTRKHTQAY